MATVWRIVDDTSSDITYSSEWTISSGDGKDPFDRYINSDSLTGTAFNRTLHALHNVNGTFSFKFNGTSRVGVFVTVITPGLPLNQSSLITGGCSLDGEPLISSWTLETPAPQWVSNRVFCQFPDPASSPISLGEHTLSVNMITRDANSSLDYIVYETLPNPVSNGEIFEIGNSLLVDAFKDPNLEFSSGWSLNKTNSAMSTSTPGSSVTVKFNGTELQLYGSLDNFKSNTATYQVDSQPPQSFSLSAPPQLAAQRIAYQMLFNISSLEPGNHSVVVTFTGQSDKMPLAINWFQATSLTAAEQAKSGNSSPTPSPSHHTPVGAIVGGTIGGLVLIALVAASLWIWKRKRPHQSITESITPFQCNKASELPGPGLSHPDTQADQAQFRNMKFQQQLAISPNHITTQSPHSPGCTIHTDSGWRMHNERQESLGELPPVYTKT